MQERLYVCNGCNQLIWVRENGKIPDKCARCDHKDMKITNIYRTIDVNYDGSIVEEVEEQEDSAYLIVFAYICENCGNIYQLTANVEHHCPYCASGEHHMIE